MGHMQSSELVMFGAHGHTHIHKYAYFVQNIYKDRPGGKQGTLATVITVMKELHHLSQVYLCEWEIMKPINL